MGDTIPLEEYVKELRIQRHDFMNDLQVIYGYLQLENYENAEEHIKKVIRRNEVIGLFYSLNNIHFAYCFVSNLKYLWSNDIDIEIYFEINKINNDNFKVYYDKYSKFVYNIFSECCINKCETVHIYIYENNCGINILISDSEEIYSDMENNFSWVDINSFEYPRDIYKLNDVEYNAYKIILK